MSKRYDDAREKDSTDTVNKKICLNTRSAYNVNEANAFSPLHVKQEELGRNAAGDENPQSASMRSSFWWPILVTAVLSAQLLFSLDITIVADVQPQIVEDLGEIDKLAWIIVAFELGAASANLFWGKLYSLFESKTLFISAVVIFEAGSALCGAAPTMNALIVGRVICGLGGNGIYLGTLNILSNLTTLQERPLYISLAGVAYSVGTICGPIVGGAFTDSHATWRWSFCINLCIGAAMAPIIIFLLPVQKKMTTYKFQAKVAKLDFAGAILFTGAFTSGIMAISFGGVTWSRDSGMVIGCFCCSGVLWILFSLQQAFVVFTSKDDRLFPVHMLGSVDLIILFAQTASSIACLMLSLFFVPLYFQFVRGDNALTAGVRLLPFIFIALFFSILNGGLMGKFGYYMPWFFGGSCLIVIGAALMRTVDVDTSVGLIYGYTVVLGAGIGSFVQASFSVAQAKVCEGNKTAVTAFIGCSQLGASALSFAIAYAVFLNLAAGKIGLVLPGTSVQDAQAAIAGVRTSLFANLPADSRTRVLQAVTESVSYVWDQILASGAFCLVLSIFMKRERLFQQTDMSE